MCRKLILLNTDKKAPTGQKYRHQPRSTTKINIMNKIKITIAIQKYPLGTNFPGLRIRMGIVPVRTPIGQMSVKINPIRNEVRKTRPMRTPYFMYRR